MTRNFNYAAEDLDYRRNPRAMPITISRTGRENSRTFSIGVEHESPNHESDGDKDKTRRRIAVACSRCRKRKIKCSGDKGNGQGCTNCKNAGTDPNQCQFLRVNSEYLTNFDRSVPQPQWTYMVESAPATVHPQPSNFNTYHLNTSVPSLVSSSFPGQTRSTRFSLSNSCSYPLSNSHDHYGYGLNEGIFEPYSLQHSSSGNYLAGQEPSPNPLHNSQEMPRHWPSATSQANRSSSDTLERAMLTTKYPAPGQAYMDLSSSISSPTVDNQSGFPVMTSLRDSLPTSFIGERLLPNPRSVILPTSSDGNNGHSSNNQFYSDPESITSSKAHTPWIGTRTSLDSASSSSNTIGSSASDSTLSQHNNKSSSSSPATSETNYCFMSVATTQGSSGNITSTSDFSITPISAPVGVLSNQLLPSQAYTTTTTGPYTYSLAATQNETKRNSQASTSDNTLINGFPYVHLRHGTSPGQQYPQFDTRTRDTGEVTARNTPRISVASVGNSLC